MLVSSLSLSLLVSSDCHGQSCEGTVLCGCDGTTAYANVSSSFICQSVIAYCQLFLPVMSFVHTYFVLTDRAALLLGFSPFSPNIAQELCPSHPCPDTMFSIQSVVVSLLL